MVTRPGLRLIRAVALAALTVVALVSGAAGQDDAGSDPSSAPPLNGPSDSSAILGQVQSQMPRDPMADADAAPVDALPGILILNQARLLAQSRYGQRIQRELEAASAELNSENREIEARLTAEELDLTQQRETMDPAAFRLLAIDFDERVEAIRAAQEAKGRALQAQAEAAQAGFFELSFPILLELVQARGGSVLLDSRTVLLAAEIVDITEPAIVAVDEALGEGGPEPLVEVGAGPDSVETPDR